MVTSISERELQRKQEKFFAKYGNAPVESGEAPKYLRALIYGPPNVGKTVTACSLGNRNLLFAADDNWVSVLNHPEVKERTAIYRNQDIEHLANMVDAVGNGYEGFTGFDNFIIDTYAQLVEDFVDALTNNSRYLDGRSGSERGYREKATFEGGMTLHGKSEIPIAGGPDYNIVRNYFRPIITALNTLPMHVIYIAHETDPKNHIANTVQALRANLPQATYNSLVRRCNIIGRMDVDNKGNRSITFKKTATVEAGAKVANLNDRTITVERFIEEVRSWSNI